MPTAPEWRAERVINVIVNEFPKNDITLSDNHITLNHRVVSAFVFSFLDAFWIIFGHVKWVQTLRRLPGFNVPSGRW